ncbi:hypothetical protein GYMLUDRAFT_94025 [Collybiopsis luxurians FD-317 M1]|nr:hypothetical protein GYMLUDRAFT_94025 [Collybiopsis luxurians FD-317 M1]
MKTPLFSPMSWRKKKAFAEQQDECPPTPTRSFLSSSSRPSSSRQRSPVSNAGSSIERSTSLSKTSPRRPPRPPSLNLSVPPPTDSPAKAGIKSASAGINSSLSTLANRRPILVKAKRSMPELDGVWKGFLADVDEDVNLLDKHPIPKLPSLHHHSRSDLALRQDGGGSPNSRHVLCSSKSTNNLSKLEWSPSPRSSVSSSDSLSTDFDSLALFPAPPPLKIRKKVPKALVLRPMPSIASLPPSPGLSSPESTPVTTPTTPTPSQCLRKTTTPPSILKKPSSPALSHSFPAGPDPLASELHNNHGSCFRPGRIAHSLSSPTPGSPPMSMTAAHRSTSSDIITFSNPSRNKVVPSRSNKSLPPAEQHSYFAPEVEWGIAV